MKLYNPFRDLSRFERTLWLTSIAVITLSFFLSGGSLLSLTASLIGVTGLIFVAKGYVIGQVLVVIFSVFYGIISWFFRYYGEMITYLGMSSPIAIVTAVSWLRHPYRDTQEVEVVRLRGKHWLSLVLSAIAVTAVFYFILKALGNASLFFSTLSVTTSWIASYLTFLRSPYYALGYASNDIVLIILWIIAAVQDLSCLPMVLCFVMFLANDLYGFYNWRRMQKRQSQN
ncbi:MAG: nicotinamide mononucleotide transporter [Ruminococcaceae bacterium]|nr:nicotinamide mononucleotide transporter [Oscillospiraceae bacterium]